MIAPSSGHFLPTRRTLLGCVLALIALLGSLDRAVADRRVALVVGNSKYQNIARLDNPANDAALMAKTLKDIGFVLVGDSAQLDLDKPSLDLAVQKFGQAMLAADVALFYYAGHGVQVRGTNYLVPINANPVREADVDFQMVDINVVLNQMQGSGTRLNLVVLDACRNNPFGGRGLRSSEGGLAQMRAPEGTLISYATQPGNVAQDGADGDSPYTKALAKTLRRAGLDIFQAFNEVGLDVKRSTAGSQQPWVSSSPIDGTFYFVAPAASLPSSASGVKQEALLTSPSEQVGAAAVTDCDRLAANPADPQHVASVAGVRLTQIEPVAALRSCNAAMRDHPDVPRFVYQAGRIASAQRDFALARQFYEKAAAAGYSASYLNLGQLYAQGSGVPQDYAEARKWYEKALASGDQVATAGLGSFYEQGKGVTKDVTEARKYYERGAAAGVGSGMVNLARLYRDGVGVSQDSAEARKWYLKAVAIGDPTGMSGLGDLANKGMGVPQDYAEARRWYERGAAGGDPGAMNALGYLYEQGRGVTQDFAQARKWYEQSAAFGQTNAMSNLGNLYRDGRGVPKDYLKARGWYEKAAAAGRTYAMLSLGNMYLTGVGVAKDTASARKWYEMAASAGDDAAKAQLRKMDATDTK